MSGFGASFFGSEAGFVKEGLNSLDEILKFAFCGGVGVKACESALKGLAATFCGEGPEGKS